jgi:hypothetical protein
MITYIIYFPNGVMHFFFAMTVSFAWSIYCILKKKGLNRLMGSQLSSLVDLPRQCIYKQAIKNMHTFRKTTHCHKNEWQHKAPFRQQPWTETTPHISPLFHYRRGGLIRWGLLWQFLMWHHFLWYFLYVISFLVATVFFKWHNFLVVTILNYYM